MRYPFVLTPHRPSTEAAPSGSSETARCHQQGLSVSDSQSQLPTQISSPFARTIPDNTFLGRGHTVIFPRRHNAGWEVKTNTAEHCSVAGLQRGSGGVVKWTLCYFSLVSTCVFCQNMSSRPRSRIDYSPTRKETIRLDWRSPTMWASNQGTGTAERLLAYSREPEGRLLTRRQVCHKIQLLNRMFRLDRNTCYPSK